MVINNFRIIRLDSYNLTFEEYKNVESNNKGIKTISAKWVRVGGYYSCLEQCLNGLKRFIIDTYAELESYQEVLDKVNALHNAIVECKMSVHIPDDDL